MNTLLDIRPCVRYAARYRYRGLPAEATRQGSLFALHLFTEEHGSLEIEGRSHPVGAGTLIFLRPGQWHNFQFHPDNSSISYNIYFSMWPDPPEIRNLPSFSFAPVPLDRRLLTVVRACSELDALPTSCRIRNHPFLEEALIRINRLYESQPMDELRGRMVDSMMLSFLLQWHDETARRPSLGDPRMLKVTDALEQHPERKYSMEELCGIVGLEKSRFYKLFQRETGMTPKAFHLQARMKKAVALLLESNLPVTAIAERLGYESIHYFSLQFAKTYGLSPTAFRKRHRL